MFASFRSLSGLLGALVLFTISYQADSANHRITQNAEPESTISSSFLDAILKSMKSRFAESYKDCFSREYFDGALPDGKELSTVTFAEAARILVTYIMEGCKLGEKVSLSKNPKVPDAVQTLKSKGYRGCEENKMCFNEFSAKEMNATATDLILYIHEGRCLLPDKQYFASHYLSQFKDEHGQASPTGLKEFLKKLGIGKTETLKKKSKDSDGYDVRYQDEEHDKKDENNDIEESDEHEQNPGSHRKGHKTPEISADTDISLDETRDEKSSVDALAESDQTENQAKIREDNEKNNESPDKNDKAGESQDRNSADSDLLPENNKEMDISDLGLLDSLEKDLESFVNDAGDSVTGNHEWGFGELGQPVDFPENTAAPDGESTPGGNTVLSRRKRSSHVTEKSRCYSSDQLMDIFEIDDDISDNQAMELCPALIQQMQTYGYGTASVAIISLLALLGLALFPIMDSTAYKLVMQFFIGLAVGTLSSDALIHIIPQVMGVHDHSAHEDEGHDAHEDKLFIWQMSVVFGGIYIVAGFESFLRAVKKHRSLTKHKRELNTYQESPGIDNLPDETGTDHAVTSFGCDVVSNNSIPKDKKPHRSDSEQMLPRQDIICCNLTPTLITVFIGDVLHNFADGLAIGVGFAEHWSTGISTSIAIMCHELPHEIGDFAIYLRNGASKWKAIGLNFTAACCNFIGLYSGINMASDEAVRRWLLCVIAGIFLYISLVQVMSTMLKDVCDRPILQFFIQNVGMLLGWTIMLLIALYEENIRIGT